MAEGKKQNGQLSDKEIADLTTWVDERIQAALGIKFSVVRRKSSGEFVRVGTLSAVEREDDPDLRPRCLTAA